MEHFTKIVFGIDQKLHNEIYVGMCLPEKEFHGETIVEFDTGEKYICVEKDENFLYNAIPIPEKASKINITSSSNIKAFGSYNENPAITSIDHFESNTITNMKGAFYGFTNVKEFKHFDVTSKVTEANFMCSGWGKFNGSIPESFYSIFEYLENGFCMFEEWCSFNQPLPEDFFLKLKRLQHFEYMFHNWNSYKHELPETVLDMFVEHRLFRKENICYGWHNNSQIKEGFLWYGHEINDYKRNELFERNKLIIENRNKIEDILLLNKLKNYNNIIINITNVNSNINYKCCYINGIFCFIEDLYFKNKEKILQTNKEIFGKNIDYYFSCEKMLLEIMGRQYEEIYIEL